MPSPFQNDMQRLFNTPGIPGIPNSSLGDPFGIGSYFGFDNPFDGLGDKLKMLPYIIIGGGALVIIFVLKK